MVFAQVRNGGADPVREGGENADNLPLFGVHQVAQLVVGGKNLGRFDEDSLARGRLVVDKSLQAAFELGLDGDAEASVADSHFRILLGDAVLFGGGQQLADFFVGIIGDVDDGALDATQFLRGVVAQPALRVKDAVDGG